MDRLDGVRNRALDALEGDASLELRVWLDRELRALMLEVAGLGDEAQDVVVRHVADGDELCHVHGIEVRRCGCN